MARKTKPGLDYFPMDVNFFEDDKVQFVSARFGAKGENITLKLLCKIYSGKGYFYQWGEDESLLFAKRAGFDVALVNDVVHELIKRDFFNEDIFNSFQILTSKGIQERYFEAAKRKKIDDVNSEILINVTSKPLNVTIKPLNVTQSTQSKIKESKVNKTKVNGFVSPDLNFDFVDDRFTECFFKWINYRKDKKEPFMLQVELEGAYRQVIELSGNDSVKAAKIIKESIDKGWKHLYALKTEEKPKATPVYVKPKAIIDK